MPKSRLKRLLFFISAIACLLALAVIFHAPILTAIAQAYIVNDPITTKADAVAALGGGLQYRTFEAARLYHAGLAQKVLTINAKLSPTDELGLTKPEREIFRQVLLKENVPDDAIIAVGHDCTTTYMDVLAVREWMLTNHAHTIIVPTDIFHTRRLRWVLRKAFKGTDLQFRVDAITPREYCATNWWRHEEGLIGFQNEIIKFGFYLLKY